MTGETSDRGLLGHVDRAPESGPDVSWPSVTHGGHADGVPAGSGSRRLLLRRRGLTLVETSALVVGAFACMATGIFHPDPDPSPPPVVGPPAVAEPPPGSLLLENQTDGVVELRVRWVEAELDCDAVRDVLPEAVGRELFGAGVTYRMDPDAYVSLDRPGAGLPGCEVVLIQSTQLGERILYWRPNDVLEGQEILPIRGTGGAAALPELAEGGSVFSVEPVEAAATAYCTYREAAESYGWSSLELPQEVVLLSDVRETVDGCQALTLVDALDREHRLYLCVPAEEMLFAAGDTLHVVETAARGVDGQSLDLWREAAPGVPFARMHVQRGVSEVAVDGFFPFALSLAGACDGDRLPCGGYRVAAAVRPSAGLGSGGMLVGPGDALDLGLVAEGTRARLRIGRAERMVVTRTECGADRNGLGDRIDAIVTYWEESE